ncbi:tetratricopeptide repeat protein [Salinibacter altiplanensis]|uniref:tetratricopeptide repeat protein n=1 Tax=Salinibacter altiplanensis TaxID=1803181 RepID=UPI001F4673B1|nr:tetratricopeptide repeat protein [Salinibacter altiplanensis]
MAVILGLGLLLGVAAGPAHAQQSDSTQLKKFQRANGFLRTDQPERALPLLERLYDNAPENTAFYRKLKEAYESIKRYDDALRLVDQRIGSTPTVPLLTEKARLLSQKDKVEAANDTWDRAVALAPEEAQTYRTVYNTLAELRHFRKAIAVLREGRTALGRPDAFRTELAHLYGLNGQFEAATQEYVAFLGEAPNRLGYVQSRLQTFVEQGQGLEASSRVLQRTVQENPLNEVYRKLLAWLHTERNDYAAAFDEYRALDRLGDRQGQILLQFARRAADAQRYDAATRACEAIQERHPESGVAPEAQKLLGDLYRQWARRGADSTTAAQDSARYAKARTAYDTFLQENQGHSGYPEALLRLGTLQIDAYRALEDAQPPLERLVSNHGETTAADEGRYQLGRIAVLRDSLDRARLLFSRLAASAQSSDLADQAQYELARLHLYRAEFDAAMARATSISEDPSADVANDAIELKALLQEARGPDSSDTALRTFVRARLSQRQHAHGPALAALDTLLQRHSRHPLADDARFRRGDIHRARGDTAAALTAFRALAERHPRSPYADRSLFRAAALLEASGRSAAATEAYRRLLTEYPTSLLAGDARGRLRALKRPEG